VELWAAAAAAPSFAVEQQQQPWLELLDLISDRSNLDPSAYDLDWLMFFQALA
jgi:hypothetical protein